MADFDTFIERFQHKAVVEYPNNVVESVPAPKVSCWIVAYNQADYVRQAIDSVVTQVVDFPIEIIIGDDDSNDGTREILIEYAQKHPSLIRLFLHSRENNIPIHGGTPNPNFQGIYNWQQCRGEYIATLECDDFWTDPEKLKKQVRFLDENPAHMGVCTNFSVVDTKGNLVKPQKYPSVQFPDYRFQYALRFHTISRTLTCMYRNVEVVKNVLPQLAQAPFLDRIILALMTQHGPMHCLPEVMASFRSGSGFFTPHREAIGNHQLVNQWEILTQHFENTALESTSIAVLHQARNKRDQKLGSKQRFSYLLRQLDPKLREPYFNLKWYLIFRMMDPVSIPLSMYAVDKSRLVERFDHTFSILQKDNFTLESVTRDAVESRLDAFEVHVPYSIGIFKFAINNLPEKMFQVGFRLLDIKLGDPQKHIRGIRMLFVREGSHLESSLYS